jgi:membrane protease YdiL (CAAX protease family)
MLATFALSAPAQSLLWLWILLAVLLLIAIIAILYALYINGKIKRPLFLLRFVTWIVGLFFGLCLAVSAFGLWFVGLFGKSDKAEDYGFEPENAEETKKED